MKVQEKDLEFIKTPKPVETKVIASVKGKDFHVSPGWIYVERDMRMLLEESRNISMMPY